MTQEKLSWFWTLWLFCIFRSIGEYETYVFCQHQCNSIKQRSDPHVHLRGKPSSSRVQVLLQSCSHLFGKQQLRFLSDTSHWKWILFLCAYQQSWLRRQRWPHYHCRWYSSISIYLHIYISIYLYLYLYIFCNSWSYIMHKLTKYTKLS